jgi:fatty-acyl-CoA synthase
VTTLHERFWPRGLPKTVPVPQTSLSHNLAVSAARFPDKPAFVFYDNPVSYGRLQAEVDAMAGYLQQHCGVRKGDRVLLFSQSCPQLAIAYYAILRADAMVVPLNAMSTANELRHYAEDSGARVAFVAQELFAQVEPMRSMLDHVLVHRYGDYLPQPASVPVPDWLLAAPLPLPDDTQVVRWHDALALACSPRPATAGPDDLCVLPFTSGTTGRPKGCVHTHGSMMAAIWSAALWRGLHAETVFLGVAPMFHLLGMQNGMNLPILLGATVVIAPRWDRDFAGAMLGRYRVTAWTVPPSALVDFFANPDVERYDLSSLTLVTGGGGAVPEALAMHMRERFGLTLNEAYGMTETASFLHCNPLHRPKVQCLGVPTFGVDTRIVDPETLQELPLGEVGEIVTSGAQTMREYWRNPEATRLAFVAIGGRRFLRTGDLGHQDEDGYFFLRDRLKRMVNVAGFKVWPAEVESRLYEHPAVLEACVVGVADARQGEAVKALVRLRPEALGTVSEQGLIDWARERMAVYKAPRTVVFVEEFPRSATGKILWRALG